VEATGSYSSRGAAVRNGFVSFGTRTENSQVPVRSVDGQAARERRMHPGTPYYPPSWSKDSFFMGLRRGGGARLLQRLKIAVDSSSDWSLPPNAATVLRDRGPIFDAARIRPFLWRNFDSSSLCAKASKLPAKRGEVFGEWNQGVSEQFSRGGVDIKNMAGPGKDPLWGHGVASFGRLKAQ